MKLDKFITRRRAMQQRYSTQTFSVRFDRNTPEAKWMREQADKHGCSASEILRAMIQKSAGVTP